ncbi:MAG: DUF3237 domain-containing protein [Acidobacteria bacterium]|nr:MAG: DUF3237 domain-containing protein [Acidobacteriota bacterium]
MPIELIPLCKAEAVLAPPMPVRDPYGSTLLIFEVESISVEGERIRAELAGQASADWMRLSPDMIGTLDVRVTLKTHDGALIYGEYRGRVNTVEGDPDVSAVVFAAPLFSTSDARYEWLNRIQVIAKGLVSADSRRLNYEMYEVR